jgi:hypothetical protein
MTFHNELLLYNSVKYGTQNRLILHIAKYLLSRYQDNASSGMDDCWLDLAQAV